MPFDRFEVATSSRTRESRPGTQPADVVESLPREREEGLEWETDRGGDPFHLAEEGNEVVRGHTCSGVVLRPCLWGDRENQTAERGHNLGAKRVPGDSKVVTRPQTLGADYRIGKTQKGVQGGDPFVRAQHLKA